MHKSQLRRLASDFANGKIEREEYARRRTTLVDGIVDGEIEIVREAPPPPPAPAPVSTPEPEAEIEAPGPRLSALHVVVGGVVGLAILAVTWWLWPAPPPPVVRNVVPAIAPPAPEPAAQRLVEGFLAARDWNATRVESFKLGWDALTPAEREQAKSAPSFRRLTRAIRDELKTQRALLEFDQTGEVVATGARLLAIGELLGVADTLPDFPIPDQTIPAAAPDSNAGPDPDSDPDSDPDLNRATVPETSTSQVEAAAPPDEDSTVSSLDWLAMQPRGRYTLQLFAVDNLDKIGHLIERNPDLQFVVLDFAGSTPRYRVLHGSFESADAATAAHRQLPDNVRQEQPTAYAKALDELRATQAGENTPSANPESSWLALQDAAHYTVQLFASSNRENVDRLISSHPALGLKLHITQTDQSYRVLYGAYRDEATARDAVAQLPPDVLAGTGAPLIKTISDLQAIAAP